ncbi:MAG: HAMP domain-containing protein [Acidobacteria bacterium]|nr:HAMP domain-containing protein [Acidobacteriota bacterium]
MTPSAVDSGQLEASDVDEAPDATVGRRFHPLGWRVKAVLPVAAVLLAGLVAFVMLTISFEGQERKAVILVATAGAVAICAVLLIVLAVFIERPLAELQREIARLQAGDLSVQVDFAQRNDEIGELGRNFNQMVRQLRENREEIEHLHRTQISRAEHLATLGELAAGLAHEIRNPLAGIAGVIEIIGRDLPESNPNREVLREVQQEVVHIKQILSELLDYARPKPANFRPADLNATAEHAVALARQQTLSRPIQIDLLRADGLPPVEHDAAQIQQVLLNLLLNAIQAISGTGNVRVILEPRDGFAKVAVNDTGRGIAPEHLGSIFRPFFTTKGQGTGLGLSLARRIVEDHGGRIEVSSQVGVGTQFTVWLPYRTPAGRGTPARARETQEAKRAAS